MYLLLSGTIIGIPDWFGDSNYFFQNVSELIIPAHCMKFSGNRYFKAKTAIIIVFTEWDFSHSHSWNSYFHSWKSLLITQNYLTTLKTHENLLTLLKMSQNHWTSMKYSGSLWKNLNITEHLRKSLVISKNIRLSLTTSDTTVSTLCISETVSKYLKKTAGTFLPCSFPTLFCLFSTKCNFLQKSTK